MKIINIFKIFKKKIKIYENKHFKIYKYDDDLFLVKSKFRYPAYYLNEEDTKRLIKDCSY